MQDITSPKEKKPVGKKAKYGSPEEIQIKIDEYFSKYENPEPLKDAQGFVLLDKQGKPVFKEELPSSSGLAYHLGFSSRCMLTEYSQKPTFAEVMKRARLRLNTYWEPYLNSKNSNGVRYFLSNSFDDWLEPDANNSKADKTPVIAQIVFIDSKGKYAKPSEIPVIEGEVIEAKTIAKTSKIKALSKPKAKTKVRRR